MVPPTAGDALETVALGDSDAVNHLILLEDRVDLDWLLEETLSEVNLLFHGATIDLDLHQVCLLLLEGGLADLCVCQNADDGAVLLHPLQVAGDALAAFLSMLLGILGESLLLALVPVLVEAPLELVGEMLSPHSSQRAEATRVSRRIRPNQRPSSAMSKLYGSAHAINGIGAIVSYRRSFDDGARLDDLLLVILCAPGRSRSRTMVVMPAL